MKRIFKQLMVISLAENNSAKQQYFLPIMLVKIKTLESTLLNAGVGGILCVHTIFILFEYKSYIVFEKNGSFPYLVL